jgi:hypothetical protein
MPKRTTSEKRLPESIVSEAADFLAAVAIALATVELLPSLRVYEPVAVATFVPLTVVSVPFSKKT